jgi:hypothetical protein
MNSVWIIICPLRSATRRMAAQRAVGHATAVGQPEGVSVRSSIAWMGIIRSSAWPFATGGPIFGLKEGRPPRRHQTRRPTMFHHLAGSDRLGEAAAYAAAAAYFGAFVVALEAALSKLVY